MVVNFSTRAAASSCKAYRSFLSVSKGVMSEELSMTNVPISLLKSIESSKKAIDYVIYLI